MKTKLFLSILLILTFTSLTLIGASTVKDSQAEDIDQVHVYEGKLDPKDPRFFDKMKVLYGMEKPPKYGTKKCYPDFKGDTCLPTAYVDGLYKGEPDRTLWKISLLIFDEKFQEAYKTAEQLRKKHPKNTRLLWLTSYSLFFIAENMDSDDIKGRLEIFNRGQKICEECLKIDPDQPNLCRQKQAYCRRRNEA